MDTTVQMVENEVKPVMDTTVHMAESEVEANYVHNSMDGRERSGSQLWTQQYRWQRARWKTIMDTALWMAESEVEAN